jgi:DtxR family transcriptional regulator, Mn-dependent transcriptional regulator
MVTGTAEDYLKAVLKIEDGRQKATTSGLARELNLADATVTDMLRKLQRAGLLEYKPYYGATLTKRGRIVALGIVRRHRLIELFLHEVLGYGWEEVHEEAEKLEHAVSDLFVERVDRLLRFPLRDPHGELIPDQNGFRPDEEDICLEDAAPGHYRIQRIVNNDSELLNYLERQSVGLGAYIELLDRAPFDGPLQLRIEGGTTVHLGVRAAKCIFVVAEGPDSNRHRAPLAEKRRKKEVRVSRGEGSA